MVEWRDVPSEGAFIPADVVQLDTVVVDFGARVT
jgi:hypothetical protein